MSANTKFKLSIPKCLDNELSLLKPVKVAKLKSLSKSKNENGATKTSEHKAPAVKLAVSSDKCTQDGYLDTENTKDLSKCAKLGFLNLVKLNNLSKPPRSLNSNKFPSLNKSLKSTLSSNNVRDSQNSSIKHGGENDNQNTAIFGFNKELIDGHLNVVKSRPGNISDETNLDATTFNSSTPTFNTDNEESAQIKSTPVKYIKFADLKSKVSCSLKPQLPTPKVTLSEAGPDQPQIENIKGYEGPAFKRPPHGRSCKKTKTQIQEEEISNGFLQTKKLSLSKKKKLQITEGNLNLDLNRLKRHITFSNPTESERRITTIAVENEVKPQSVLDKANPNLFFSFSIMKQSNSFKTMSSHHQTEVNERLIKENVNSAAQEKSRNAIASEEPMKKFTLKSKKLLSATFDKETVGVLNIKHKPTANLPKLNKNHPQLKSFFSK